MNIFFVFDVASLVLVILIMFFLMVFRNSEEQRFHNRLNAILFGLFFVLVFFVLVIVSYFVSSNAVVYSMNLVVVPLAAVFFLVSVILPSELA